MDRVSTYIKAGSLTLTSTIKNYLISHSKVLALLSLRPCYYVMAAGREVRDGEFVRFLGWDVIGNDQASFLNLRGNVSALKKTVLENQEREFYAFNTDGWIKSWDVLDYSKFERSAGSDLS